MSAFSFWRVLLSLLQHRFVWFTWVLPSFLLLSRPHQSFVLASFLLVSFEAEMSRDLADFHLVLLLQVLE